MCRGSVYCPAKPKASNRSVPKTDSFKFVRSSNLVPETGVPVTRRCSVPQHTPTASFQLAGRIPSEVWTVYSLCWGEIFPTRDGGEFFPGVLRSNSMRHPLSSRGRCNIHGKCYICPFNRLTGLVALFISAEKKEPVLSLATEQGILTAFQHQ